MEEQERRNPSRVSSEWLNRPRLSRVEEDLFIEFLRFSRSCGGEITALEIQAWFQMRQLPDDDRVWMCDIFGAMSVEIRNYRKSPDND